jgi:hypothetical protein
MVGSWNLSVAKGPHLMQSPHPQNHLLFGPYHLEGAQLLRILLKSGMGGTYIYKQA